METPALRAEFAALLRLAGPLIAAQLAHVLMVFTDTVMMGLLGPAELAGGSLGAAAYALVSFFCVGVVSATGNLVAIRQGAGDPVGAARLVQAGLWLAGALAVAAGLLLWTLRPLLLAVGQAPANVDGAMAFLSTLVLALPGFLAFMVLRGFTSAIGRPGPVMAISIGGALGNVALNYALIKGWFGVHLGLAGIGLVTAVVMSAMGLLLGRHVWRHPGYAAYPLRQGFFRPSREALQELWRLGLPIGGTYAVESGLFTFAALCMGTLGSLQLAAHQIALQSVYVAFMVPVGISYAVTFRIGQHYGAGRLDLARRVGRMGMALGATCMLGFAALFWLAPTWVVGLFLDLDDPQYREVVALAVRLLAIAALFELCDGLQTIAMGAIRGLKDARTTFLVGLACYWLVGAPAAWLLALPLGWGAEGVWWGLAAGLACAALGLGIGFEWKVARLLRGAPAGTLPQPG